VVVVVVVGVVVVPVVVPATRSSRNMLSLALAWSESLLGVPTVTPWTAGRLKRFVF
jgi:hypothetical protein